MVFAAGIVAFAVLLAAVVILIVMPGDIVDDLLKRDRQERKW